MKILVVCQYFYPEPFRVSELCSNLQSRGHEITILTGMPNYPEGRYYTGYGLFGPMKETYKDGINVIRVPVVPRGSGGKIQLALNYLSFMITASIRSLFLFPRKFDIAFVYQLSPITMAFPAIFLAKLKGIPMVLYSLDIWPDSVEATGIRLPALALRILEKMSRFIYLQAARLLVSSQGFVERLVEMGVPQKKLHYWPQSTETFFSQTISRPDDSLRDKIPSGFVVMFAGNIGAAQGFPTIIDAADKLRDLPDLHWVVLGDGRMRSWVETEVQTRRLHRSIHLMGRYPAEEMPCWFSLADALLVTLKKDPVFALTLPAKVQSYMACGRPILAAMDGEGAAVVQQAKAGLVCQSDDSDALAVIVRKMYDLPKVERELMGANGAVYAAAHFNRDKLIQELEHILLDAIIVDRCAKT